jgi:hypothetical protein
MPRPVSHTTTPNLGVILADATYPLPEFKRLSGLGEAALRQARRQGLMVTAIGRRRFVRGADFHAFIGSRPRVDRGASA